MNLAELAGMLMDASRYQDTLKHLYFELRTRHGKKLGINNESLRHDLDDMFGHLYQKHLDGLRNQR